tara:strand:- start:101 stop:205 length:105 start_codon:yes stop_codon:yes gene_type:complete
MKKNFSPKNENKSKVEKWHRSINSYLEIEIYSEM